MIFVLLNTNPHVTPAALLGFALAILVICGFCEGLILHAFRVGSFRRSTGQALKASLVSLAACVAFMIVASAQQWKGFDELSATGNKPILWLSYFGLTVLVETLALKTMNRARSWMNVFCMCLAANTMSFAFLYVVSFLIK